jgi:mRNA interferase RelE/StbE
LSNIFQIAETETFQRNILKPEFHKLYEKITKYIYPQLRANPFFGPNIKKLKGPLVGLYRYRIGRYRLFYRIDGQKVIVYILDIYDRKDSY